MQRPKTLQSELNTTKGLNTFQLTLRLSMGFFGAFLINTLRTTRTMDLTINSNAK